MLIMSLGALGNKIKKSLLTLIYVKAGERERQIFEQVFINIWQPLYFIYFIHLAVSPTRM